MVADSEWDFSKWIISVLKKYGKPLMLTLPDFFLKVGPHFNPKFGPNKPKMVTYLHESY